METLKGTIESYNESEKLGKIVGEDGITYGFSAKDVHDSVDVKLGTEVCFDANSSGYFNYAALYVRPESWLENFELLEDDTCPFEKLEEYHKSPALANYNTISDYILKYFKGDVIGDVIDAADYENMVNTAIFFAESYKDGRLNIDDFEVRGKRFIITQECGGDDELFIEPENN